MLFVAPALVVCAQTAAAADPPDDSIWIDPVEVKDAPAAERDPTARTTVVRVSESVAVDALGDALMGVPGVQLRREGGFGRRLSVALRGTDNQQLLVLYDDVPISSGLGGGFDLSLLPLGGVGRVEVYRGGSTAFGSSAVAGAIRIVPPPFEDAPTAAAELSAASFGTFALSGEASAIWGGRERSVGRGGVRAHWTLRQSGGDFDFVDTNGVARTRENNDSRGVGGGIEAEQAFEAGVLRAGVLTHSESRGIAGVEQFPTRSARQDSQFTLARLRWAGPTRPDGDDEWVATAWWRDRDVSFRNPGDPVEPLPPVDNHQRAHQVGGLARWWGPVSDWSAFHAQGESTYEWSQVRLDDRDRAPSRAQLAGVVGFEWGIGSGQALVHPAVRVDWASDGAARVLPKLGALVDLGAGFEWSASAARTFRRPSFEELYFDAGGVFGNPNLDPELAWHFDLGLSWSGPGIRVQATAYYLLIDNLVLFLPVSPFLIRAENSGEAVSRGVELHADWDIVQGLNAQLSYTWVDAMSTVHDAPLAGRSPHLVSARISGRLFAWLQCWGQARWQDRFYLDRFGSLSEESRLWLDAGLQLGPWRGVRLALAGTNLLDKRDAVDSIQYPLPGRAFMGTLRWE